MITALCCDLRCLHPCRTTSNHHHARSMCARFLFSGLVGMSNSSKLKLVSGSGCLNAAKAQVEAHAPDAILVAGDAEPNRLSASLARLACKIRIADLAAHHVYHVRQALTQDAFGLYRVLDAPGAEDRQFDRLANTGRNE